MKFQKTVKKSIVYTPTPNRSVYVIGAAGFCALIQKISKPKPVGGLSARLSG